MEKDNSQPKTQPSGNKPPPRPPTRIAIGMLPGDEGPENNRRRRAQRENVRINLPPRSLAEPSIKLPLLPGAITAVSKKTPSAWPVAVLLILAIWAFVGAMVTMTLYSVFPDGYRWEHSNNLKIALVLLLLWAIPAQFVRFPKFHAGRR